MDSLSDLVHRKNSLAIFACRQLFPYELSLHLSCISYLTGADAWDLVQWTAQISPWAENMPGLEKGILEPLNHLLPTTTTTTTNNNTINMEINKLSQHLLSSYYVPDTTLHPLNTYHLSFILTQSCCVFLCVCLGCSVGWTVELGWGREVNHMVISDEQHLKKYLENLKTVKKKKNLGGKERKSEVSRVLQIAEPRLGQWQCLLQLLQNRWLVWSSCKLLSPSKARSVLTLFSIFLYLKAHSLDSYSATALHHTWVRSIWAYFLVFFLNSFLTFGNIFILLSLSFLTCRTAYHIFFSLS